MGLKNRLRGQVATEFFVTYGWAILIVLAIMAVMYSTIFKPEFYVAERCDIAPGLVCDSFTLTQQGPNSVRLSLTSHNTMGFTIRPELTNFTLQDPLSKTDIESQVGQGAVLPDGESITLITTFPVGEIGAPGTLYRVRFAMSFSNQDVQPITYHRTAGVVNVRLSE